MKRYTGFLFKIEQMMIGILDDRFLAITFNARNDLEIILENIQSKIKKL